IGRSIPNACDSRHRGSINDAAATLEQMRDDMFRTQEHALKVHIHTGLPSLLILLGHGAARRDSRVVMQYVNSSEERGDLRDSIADLRFIGHVHSEGCRFAAVRN